MKILVDSLAGIRPEYSYDKLGELKKQSTIDKLVEHVKKDLKRLEGCMEPDSYYYYRIGNDNLEKGQIEKAIENFSKSCELNEHFKTYERLYLCYCKLLETDKAYKSIEYAYNLNNVNDKTAYLYAKSLISKGNIKRGNEILKEILSRNASYKKALVEIEKLKAFGQK